MAGQREKTNYRGCLLGGAVGDALGGAVEFMTLREIRARFGPAGLTGYAEAYGRRGAITDDTQMTLFTAEALLRAHNRALGRGSVSIDDVGRFAYMRWLHTQNERLPNGFAQEMVVTGWLVEQMGLHARRAPGNTCLGALKAGAKGTPQKPANDSKGCGGVMRMAPVGLCKDLEPFENGCGLAALTHGHPSGFLSAGFFAQLVYELGSGASLRDAVTTSLWSLETVAGGRETQSAVQSAIELAASTSGSPEDVERLGAGWVAEEALAIGVYCALKARDFSHGVLLAVNHSGDSDSTGSIAGNLLGLLLGEEAIPKAWLDELELRSVIEQVADDLWLHFGDNTPKEWPKPSGYGPLPDANRYPPN